MPLPESRGLGQEPVGRAGADLQGGRGMGLDGTVIRSITTSYALIDFANGETEIVPLKFILPVGGAMPCPSLQVGDYVFTRIRKMSGEEYYVPGIVIATPNKAAAEDKLYTVLKHNNRKLLIGPVVAPWAVVTFGKLHRPNVKVVRHFHRSCPAEEKEPTVAVGGNWNKKKKARKGRAKSKKEPGKEWASSDSDEKLFAPRRIAKRRPKSLSPSPPIQEESEGTISKLEKEFSEVLIANVSETEKLH
uniref:Uncharacterized protein n=1 Tax=Sphaerodactylus townsendi TaxID=933632 RepID=A0ACB8FI79_9SAUR